MYSHYISLKLSKHWEILQNNNKNVISLSPLMFKIELISSLFKYPSIFIWVTALMLFFFSLEYLFILF